MRILYFPQQKVKKHIIFTPTEQKIIQQGAHQLGGPYYQSGLNIVDTTGCTYDACTNANTCSQPPYCN